jgi:hypothetical protein
MKFADTKPGDMKREDMKCEEAAQFVSALCDGEMIPPAAAEHIGACAACRVRLKEYVEMGAELRRLASLHGVEKAKVPLWEQSQRITPNWWGKGWETMRIPRFAFAMLLAAVVALGSSLAIVRVRAHTEGPVLMLTAKTASGHTIRCALSLVDEKAASCASVQVVAGRGGEAFEFRVISKQGDRIELGLRAKFLTGVGSLSSEETERLPEATYWFQPGEKLEAKMEESEPMSVTGELMDHMPTSLAVGGDEQLDPNPNEVRFVVPVLVRGKDVVYDFDGMTVMSDEKGHGLELYVPHDGRYLVSLAPLEGGVEGQIHDSRVTFELTGQSYQFLTGAPVARGERIWILRLPDGKDSSEGDEHAFVSSVPMTQYLAKTPAKN